MLLFSVKGPHWEESSRRLSFTAIYFTADRKPQQLLRLIAFAAMGKHIVISRYDGTCMWLTGEMMSV